MSADVGAMNDVEQSIPELYREAAEKVRQLARQARLTDIRGDLLELAALFERLAANADGAIRLGLSGILTVSLSPEGVIGRHGQDRSSCRQASLRPRYSGAEESRLFINGYGSPWTAHRLLAQLCRRRRPADRNREPS